MIRIEGMLGQFLDFARGYEAEETRAVRLRSLLEQAIESCAEPSAVVLDAPADVVIRVKETAMLRALDNHAVQCFQVRQASDRRVRPGFTTSIS